MGSPIPDVERYGEREKVDCHRVDSRLNDVARSLDIDCFRHYQVRSSVFGTSQIYGSPCMYNSEIQSLTNDSKGHMSHGLFVRSPTSQVKRNSPSNIPYEPYYWSHCSEYP
jgi:hypothetical protein